MSIDEERLSEYVASGVVFKAFCFLYYMNLTVGLFSLGRILLPILFDLGLTSTPLMLRYVRHDRGDMIATTPPGCSF